MNATATASRSPLAWPRVVLAGIGLGISVYLTLVHYRHVPLLCHASGLIDCVRVVTSPQSVALGLPLAVWGVAWFVVESALALWTAVGGASGPRWLRPARLAWSVVGAMAVIYFVYLELLVIGHICLWCSGVHLIVLTLLSFEALAPGA